MGDEYTCTLNDRDLKVAKDELGENPKERLGQVETFRKWVLQQSHIKCRTDTKFLLRFLRAAKFSQLEARKKLEKFLTYKMKYPDWLKDLDMADPKIQKLIEIGFAVILPSHPDGKKMMLLRFGCLDTSNKHYTKEDVARCLIGLVLHILRDESTQVHGFAYLPDFTNAPLNFMTWMGVDDMRRWPKVWQGAFPARLKGFHFYNAGGLFDAIMAITRPFWAKKIQERMFSHGSNLEKVYKHIPMSILPDEYLPDDYTGPSAGPLQGLIDKVRAEVCDPASRNLTLLETSDEFTINMSQIPDNEPQESFRKLNID